MANDDVESETCTEKCFFFFFWHPLLVRPAMKSLFLPKPWLCLAPYPTLCPCEPLRPVGDMQAVSYGARSGQYSPLLPGSRAPARNLDPSSSDHALGPCVGFIYIIYIYTIMPSFSNDVICKEGFHSHSNTQTIFKSPDRLIGRRACLALINTPFRAWLDKL